MVALKEGEVVKVRMQTGARFLKPPERKASFRTRTVARKS